MVRGFWYSQKAEEAYKAIDLPYEKTPQDLAYDVFKRKTRTSEKNTFTVSKMIRLQVPESEDENREYILYDLTEKRIDGLGNSKGYTRTNIGTYPIPERYSERYFDEDHQPQIKTKGVSSVSTGYYIPFTPEKAEELHKLGCVDRITPNKTKRTEYIVQKLNEYKITCNSYRDWLTGDFETLYATGSADETTKPVVRAKPKKNKEQEQSDLQKEILKKPYTTNLINNKQKKEEDNDGDKRGVWQEEEEPTTATRTTTTTTTTASQAATATTMK